MYRRSDGGIELWDLLYWFPVSASSVLAEAVVQQNLGSDLELQVEVDAAARSSPVPELQFAGWGRTGHCS